jgi:cytosine/adenosine deaminase-related metal-dependent hydrolase
VALLPSPPSRPADGSSEEDLELQERGKRPKTRARLELGEDGLPNELEIPNADVLAIATLGAARVMKLDATVGSVTVGKDADCILVDGDPLARMTDVRRVVTVVKRGAVVDAVAARAALSIAPEGK